MANKRFADLANMKSLFAGLKLKYAPATHTHAEATTTTAGMMSSADKAKLDDIGGLSASDMADVVAAL